MEKENNTAIQKHTKITDRVMARIQRLESEKKIALPPNYSAENALQSAWLTLQTVVDKDKRPALSVCTPGSVANSLLDMVIQGLNSAKKQCYFIVYGNQLTLSRSYFGTQAVLQRIGYNVDATIVWEGDTIERTVESARYKIVKHESPWKNHGGKIEGVYAIVKDKKSGEELWCEMMKWEEIQNSWKKSKTYNFNNSTHREFPGEMAKRTVIERAAKNFANTRDDNDLLIEAFNRTTENQYEDDNAEDVGYEDVSIDPAAAIPEGGEVEEEPDYSKKTTGAPVYLDEERTTKTPPKEVKTTGTPNTDEGLFPKNKF